MSLTNFPNGITSFGVPIMGSSSNIPATTGSYFFVSSDTGSDGNRGLTTGLPFASIAKALTACTADKGDVIVVMPGHTETVATAAALDINVAGVSVIGLGNGALRPTLTLSAAAATVGISAANVTLDNFILVGGFADVAVGIVCTGLNITIQRCRFQQSADDLNFLSCIETSGGANTENGLKILSCERYEIDAAALAMISILEDITDLTIADNYCSTGGTTTAVGHFLIQGAFTVLDAKILRNYLNITSATTTYTVGLLITGSASDCSGVVANNLVGSLDATSELLDTATLDYQHFNNYYADALAKSGYLLPAIA